MALGSVKAAPAALGSQAFAENAALSSRYEANTCATCGSTRTRVFDQPRSCSFLLPPSARDLSLLRVLRLGQVSEMTHPAHALRSCCPTRCLSPIFRRFRLAVMSR